MKILCFLPNYIGDILMTTPAIRVIKRKIPYAEVLVVLKPELKLLLEDNPNIDGMILKLSRYFVIKNVVNFKPDYVLLFRTTFFNSLVSFLSKPKFSVGVNEEMSSFLLSLTINKDITRPYRGECVMIVEKLFDFLKLDKKDMFSEVKKLDFYGIDFEEVKKSVEKKLLELGIFDKKLIIISPCSSRETKMLTLKQYITLISALIEKLNRDYYIVLVGALDNIEFINKILSSFRSERIVSLVGKTNLKELGYLFKLSSLVITPDSGPAYISEAVGAKTLIFFTSTLPQKYGPYPQNVRLVYSALSCSPCYKKKCKGIYCIKNFPIDGLIKVALDFVMQ
ncbi:MAG: glycosyltransferase family 9 protein [Endomicrobia bacterium]|nr:glycosyltransferase family 9 protein [Endomicrobiia bacterium]